MSLFQFYSYIAGSLHVWGPQAHPQESSHSCSHNHWFSVCTALAVCSVCCAQHIIYCRISTCFGPTGQSSGEFTQLFTQPVVQCLYCSGRVLCMLYTTYYILPDLYMFRAHRPILRRVHTAIGSVSVLLWPCALYVVIQSTRPEQYRH